MKTQTVSLRTTGEDCRNINELRIRYGGIGISEVLRLAVTAVYSGKVPTPICPKIAPIPQFEETVRLLRTFVGVLETAARHGWPDHFEGETPERTKQVDDGRAEFESVRAALAPELARTLTLLRAVHGAAEMNISKVRHAGVHIERMRQQWHKVAGGLSGDPTKQVATQRAVDELSEMLAFLSHVGLADVPKFLNPVPGGA
jgi:hypothetical protein